MGEISFYSSLFRYLPTESRSPLEDFLTEAFADLLNRCFSDGGNAANQAKSLIAEVLCEAKGGIEHRIRGADLRVITQLPIRVGRNWKRLDLCLWAGHELVLAVENKVVEVRRKGRQKSNVDPGNAKKVAEQLEKYAGWLNSKYPAAGLVLLGVDDAPSDFPTNATRYPAGFRSVCHWERIHERLGTFTGVGSRGLRLIVENFRQFLGKLCTGRDATAV